MANTPNPNDPFNPVPPTGTDPRVDRTTVVQSRSGGSGWLIALVVVILAVVAYYVFGRSGEAPAPAEPPAASTPAPAPAPAEPMKPAEPAPAPAEPAPAPAPAEPAPAPAQ